MREKKGTAGGMAGTVLGGTLHAIAGPLHDMPLASCYRLRLIGREG